MTDDQTTLNHGFIGVAGHPDDDECTYRSDGTDATYCGEIEDAHVTTDQTTHDTERFTRAFENLTEVSEEIERFERLAEAREFVPETADIRDTYVDANTGGEYGYLDDGQQATAEFDRWLAGLLAEAWDEGFEEGATWEQQVNGIPHDPPMNPYRAALDPQEST